MRVLTASDTRNWSFVPCAFYQLCEFYVFEDRVCDGGVASHSVVHIAADQQILTVRGGGWRCGIADLFGTIGLRQLSKDYRHDRPF